jgi:hypothetical protein
VLTCSVLGYVLTCSVLGYVLTCSVTCGWAVCMLACCMSPVMLAVGEWSRPQSAASVGDVRNHPASASTSMPLTRRSPQTKGMSASTSLIVSAHGDEAASSSAGRCK